MQRRRQRAGMVLDRIAERPERPGRQQVVTRTAENPGAPCGSAPEGSHERRLARAGLTMDQDDRAPALDRVVKRPLEGLKFSCPLEEALAHLVSVAHHASLVDLENTGRRGKPSRRCPGVARSFRWRGFCPAERTRMARSQVFQTRVRSAWDVLALAGIRHVRPSTHRVAWVVAVRDGPVATRACPRRGSRETARIP